MKSNFNRHSLLLIIVVTFYTCTNRYPGPLTPDKALERFELREGFKIEPFATEPFIHDPVSMEFDEQGNVFAVEMPDYPYRPEPGKEKGRIIQLIDNNGDGRADQSIVFEDNLMEATSILPWKGGLLVTAAPHILYLKDTNGDGKSDTREILFSGFFALNSEAQITSLQFGADNWIYACNNGQTGAVTSAKDPGARPLAMSGADFRFRMDRNQFEPITGSGQFGQTLDDWGNRFITQNTLHLQQTVIPWPYWHRHSYLPKFKASSNISDHELEMFQKTQPPYWRAERTRRRNEAFKENKLDRIEYAEGHFTGASGGTIYTGDVFPKEYYGNVFTGDVAGNLVHRDLLVAREDSLPFVARRDEAEKHKEFLTSTDPWFRPVNFSQGPDGNLYLLDYYRQHIETPLSIPDDLKEEMDFLNGSEFGRIYRILPANAPAIGFPKPDLRNKSNLELVQLLSHPGKWWRLQAQRLILERQDLTIVPTLKSLFDQSENAMVRLHALYALEGLNSLTEDLVKKAINDVSPGIRVHGLILAERFPFALEQALLKMDDPGIRVAFQATLTIGNFHGEKVVNALAYLLTKYGRDPWFQMAVLSSEVGSSIELMKFLIRGKIFETTAAWKLSFLENFSYIIGNRNQKEQIVFLLQVWSLPDLIKEEKWRVAMVSGLSKGMINSATSIPHIKEALIKMEVDTATPVHDKLKQWSEWYSVSHPF